MDNIAFEVAGFFVIAGSLVAVMGYMLGRWDGYKDARRELEDKWEPKRDKRGRFIKKD